MKINLTDKFAVEIVACSNLETLGIDYNSPEILQEAMSAAGEVFNDSFNDSWSLVSENSNFSNWNGGKYCHAGYCCDRFSFNFYAIDEDGDYEWVAVENVPAELVADFRSKLEKCAEARDAVISESAKND